MRVFWKLMSKFQIYMKITLSLLNESLELIRWSPVFTYALRYENCERASFPLGVGYFDVITHVFFSCKAVFTRLHKQTIGLIYTVVNFRINFIMDFRFFDWVCTQLSEYGKLQMENGTRSCNTSSWVTRRMQSIGIRCISVIALFFYDK